MDGAAGLLQQLKLEAGITREMRKREPIQVRRTGRGRKSHGEKNKNNGAEYISLGITYKTMC